MHEHISKRAKMQRNKESQMGAQSKHDKHNIVRSRERYASSKPTSWRCILTSSYFQTNYKRDICNHTSKWPQRLVNTSPRRAQSMTKPRSRQTNTDIKHRSKQANMDMHKGNDPNPLI